MTAIRPLTEADIPAVQALEALCFAEPWSSKGLRDTLRENCTCFLGAWEERRLLGYLNATWILDELNINRLCTHPDARRQGIASQLLRALKEFSCSQGLRTLYLEVRESNLAAQLLYLRHEFTKIGFRPRFYENPQEGAILMAHQLSLGEERGAILGQ